MFGVLRAAGSPPNGAAGGFRATGWCACRAGGLAGYDAPVPAADPLGDQPPVLFRGLLPCEVTGVERVNLAVREELAEVLVVRPRHELVVPACHDLGRGRDRRQQVSEHGVLLGVVPYEPGRLRKPAEVVCAHIVLVDLGLSVARCGRLDRVADVGSGVEPANVIQAGGLDDVFERAAGLDRVADSATTDGQARDAFWRLGREEERGGCANVRTDDMRSAQSPLVDQTGQERSGAVGSDELRRLIGVAESRHVDGDNTHERCEAVPDAAKAHRLSGHGASISTVVSESALVSANLTRTPSRTRKYVDICAAVPVLIGGFPLHSTDRSVWQTNRPVCLVKG